MNLMKLKNLKEKLNKYFSEWAIKVGESIDKNAEKENWDSFDYTSAINFMLTDIQEDIEKEIKIFGNSLLDELEMESTNMIAIEINIANQERQPTSRLTSFAVKFGEKIKSLRELLK